MTGVGERVARLDARSSSFPVRVNEPIVSETAV